MRVAKQTTLAIGASTLTALLGEWDIALEILLIFIVIDYLTGIAKAIRSKSLKSALGYEGIMKKAAIFLVVVLAAQLDRIAGTPVFFRSATSFFFIANEGISILENAGELGVPIPPFIQDHLEQLRDTQRNADNGLKTPKAEEINEEDRK